jgi:hypothetical protein
MKESHGKGVANHPGPESCVAGHHKAGGEALTGVKAGWVSSREMVLFQGADAVRLSGRPYGGNRYREVPPPCAVGDPRHAWKLYAREPGGPSSFRRVRSGGPEGERDER